MVVELETALIEMKLRGYSEHTQRAYSKYIAHFLESLHSKPIPEVTDADVKAYLSTLIGKTAPRSINLARAAHILYQ